MLSRPRQGDNGGDAGIASGPDTQRGAPRPGHAQRWLSGPAELGIAGDREGPGWPPGEVVLATVARPEETLCLLAIPGATLSGAALTDFLDGVAPFGCPPPPSLIRAYALPDSPFPSILLREHAEGAEGIGEAYGRFLPRRRQWLAALEATGPGLYPALAWQPAPSRRFRALADCAEALDLPGMAMPGVGDDYLGRGLLLLAHPHLAGAWPTMMSLGGVTKARKITGREFPLWVDLPAHQAALLASPLLARAEQLLAEARAG